jgi:RNA-dependent RNA polymerase
MCFYCKKTIFGLALSYSLKLFQGPYLSKQRNVLQRTLGDDNILMVKFEEVKDERYSVSSSLDNYFAKYNKVLREGIHVGLRCYRFFG